MTQARLPSGGLEVPDIGSWWNSPAARRETLAFGRRGSVRRGSVRRDAVWRQVGARAS